MQSLKLLGTVIVGAALLSACSSTPVNETPVAEKSAPAVTTTPTADTRSVQAVNVATDPLNDPNGALAKRSVYFDFDSHLVKDEGKPVLEVHATYLSSNKGRKIVIQGNTDERGGAEYNLALGQKRAEAVRKSLSLLGVAETRMEAVSFGKEKPKAAGHDEAAWAENRRADLAY